MKKIVAIFGPGNILEGDSLYAQAETLGRQLATAGFAVVTGGYEGVMEAASKGARQSGGSVIGITADVHYAKGREANAYVTKEVRVKSATDRLMELLDLPDAWCAIGNSTGTLAEVAMAWDYMIKGFIERKLLLLIGESWHGFVEYVSSEEQFAPYMNLIEQCVTVESAADRLIALFGEQPRMPDLEVIA